MNIQELERILIEINVSKDTYSLLKGGLPNEQYCINKYGEYWEIYYSEKGIKSELRIFDNEAKACEYFLEIMERYAKK